MATMNTVQTGTLNAAPLTREALIQMLRLHAPELSEQFSVSSIGLFGSFAAGNNTDASDVDLVLAFSRPIGLRFVELADYLEMVIGRPVDLLTPQGIEGIRVDAVRQRINASTQHVWPN